MTLTKAGNPLGVSWGADDRIVYALSDGIWSVSGNGGAPEHLVKTAPGERIHGPQMLPGGQAVLFASTTASGPQGWDEGSIVVQALDSGRRTVLHAGGADPRYVSTGHLVYVLGNTLFAIPFDVKHWRCVGGRYQLWRKSGALSEPTSALPSTRSRTTVCSLTSGASGIASRPWLSPT